MGVTAHDAAISAMLNVRESYIRCAVYSLARHRLVRDELPKSVGRGSPSEVPAVLLARLALDRSLQGQGQGGHFLPTHLSASSSRPRPSLLESSSWMHSTNEQRRSTSTTASDAY